MVLNATPLTCLALKPFRQYNTSSYFNVHFQNQYRY